MKGTYRDIAAERVLVNPSLILFAKIAARAGFAGRSFVMTVMKSAKQRSRVA
jgi:hypothetical protein